MDREIIRIEDIWFDYQADFYLERVPALQGVNLVVRHSECLAIIGQNGSGKTTLVKHMNGILRPSKGRVLLEGEDIRDLSVASISQRVGYVAQNPDRQIFSGTVYDEVAFGVRNLNLDRDEQEERIDRALEVLGLKDVAKQSPFSLSKGARLQVVVASVLAMQPKVIILDEPTTGQDYRGACQVMDLALQANRLGAAIIIITHNMPLVAEYAPRTVVMHEGTIIADGPTSKVFSESEVLQRTHLVAPQVTRLGSSLRGIIPHDRAILTVPELVGAVADSLREESPHTDRRAGR